VDAGRTSPNDGRHPWRPGTFTREELSEALVAGAVAGLDCSHDRENVRWRLQQLLDGVPEVQFGLTGLSGGGLTLGDVLQLMGAEAGFDPDASLFAGPVSIDPELVLDRMEAAGQRLAAAARRGERVLLATGHPAGLLLLYMAAGELLEDHGAKLIRPGRGLSWREDHRHREIRYFRGVAVLTDRGSTRHTHSPSPMELMLEDERPDLVFADHGFAGAAIEAGVETIAIVDVNDPAPVVAKSQGRTELLVMMDDNVQPEDYWPCFQAIAAQFPR
jgi:histidinol phosphate phosphatase hisN-like protein